MSELINEAEFLAGRKHALFGADPSSIIVTAIDMGNGRFGILSRYLDAEWILPYNLFPKSKTERERKLNFQSIPVWFQPQMRQITLRYMVDGIEGQSHVVGTTIVNFFYNVKIFLTYLESKFGVTSLQTVSPLHCIQYVDFQKHQIAQNTKKPLSKHTLRTRFLAVENLHRLSLHTENKLANPWPDNSASYLSGLTGNPGSRREGETKIIPNHILASLFTSSVDAINDAERLLVLRAGVDALRSERNFQIKSNSYLAEQGWSKGLQKLGAEISSLLTSCMIVVFTTTGIRLHELAHIGAGRYHALTNKTGGYYSVIGDDGEHYYWIRTRSDKTKAGVAEFLATELTVTALQVAERITAPLREQLSYDIALLKVERPNDPRWVEKSQHSHAVFLGASSLKANDIRTLSADALSGRLDRYVESLQLDWSLTSHQFRRTFAVYVAKSAHGDLRYLAKHFKHWSLDMTTLYALNTLQEAELYNDIMVEMNDLRNATVASWFEEEAIITGGGSEGIKAFRARNEVVKTYEGRRAMVESISDTIHIRGTGTAWCTADDGGCGGGTAADKTRCGNNCSNAVIDKTFKQKWEMIYAQQLELNDIDDIGIAGQERVKRDLVRCEAVLAGLGVELESIQQDGRIC